MSSRTSRAISNSSFLLLREKFLTQNLKGQKESINLAKHHMGSRYMGTYPHRNSAKMMCTTATIRSIKTKR